MKVHTEKPFNAEPPPSLLIENFYTPKYCISMFKLLCFSWNEFIISSEVFYVRNHLPVPEVDPELYELEIEIEGTDTTKTLKLQDIMKLPKHSITSTIMCAGNRRSEMNKVFTKI